jgi:hypothetical protein
MDWVLSCTEPKRVCWGPQYTASLVKFPSTSAGSFRPHAGATPVVPRARAGRPPPDSYWLDDPAMIEAIARAHVILRVDQFPATVARDKYHFRCSSRVSSKFRSAAARF